MDKLKLLYIKVLGWFLVYINKSDKLRDFLIWPISSRILGVNYSTFVKLKNGLTLKLNMSDLVNRTMLFHGQWLSHCWEPQTAKFVETITQTKKNVLIAGSHIGSEVLQTAKNLPFGGYVYAFEPVRELYDISRQNIKANSLVDRINIEQLALGEKAGELNIKVESGRSTLVGGQDGEKVKMTTLDDYIKEKNNLSFDLVCLDVEGYEYNVFQGAANSIFQQEKLPDIVFEVNPGLLRKLNLPPETIYNFLEAKGYQLFIIDDNYATKNIAEWRNRPVSFVPVRSKFSEPYYRFTFFNVFATTGRLTQNDD